MNNQKKIERFLLSDLAIDIDKQTLGPDEDLLEQRIIDSLGIMKLVSFLERSFDVEVADDDIVPDNFHTINAIEHFIAQKLARGTLGQAGQSQIAAAQPANVREAQTYLPHTAR